MKKASILLSFFSFLIMSCNGAKSESTYMEDSLSEQTSEPMASPENPDSLASKSGPLTIAMVGDIMMGTTYPEGGNNLPADDGINLFSDTKTILQNADITAGNLEGSLFDGVGQVKRCSDPSTCFAFKMPTRYVNHLTDAGFDFVSIANNHINDFGPEAIASTQKVLKEAGIAYAGMIEDCPTAIIEKDGRKIGFAAFGFNMGNPSIMDYANVTQTIKNLRQNCDFVIVSFHGGGEGVNFQHVPHKMEVAFGQQRGDVEKFAHTAVEAGADLVFGHSPHVTRAMELYNDRLILYSLGNFCTPYRFNLAGVNSYAPIVEVTLNSDGSFDKGKIHSFIQQKGVGPRTDKSNIVARNIRKLTQEDFPATPLLISDDGSISKK